MRDIIQRREELEEKLRTFKKILAEATTEEERVSAQRYVKKYERLLQQFKLPDEAFKV